MSDRFTDLNRLPLSLPLGSFTVDMLNWGFIEPRPWRNYLHTHSCVEMCYAFAGSGTFRILDQDHEIKAGEVFVARPGEPHEIISSNDDPLGIYFWVHTLLPAHQRRNEVAGIDALMAAFGASSRHVSDRVPTMLFHRHTGLPPAAFRRQNGTRFLDRV